MRLPTLLAALLAAAAPAVRGAGPASPASLYVFPLDTTPGATAETDVDLVLHVPTASLTVYVPAGYALDFARAPGTVLGSATVLAAAGRPESALLLSSGRVTADACAPGTHAAVWSAGPVLTVFVDPTAADERSLGAYKLVSCPAPGTDDVDLDLRNALVNPTGRAELTWRALVAPSAGTPFEIRSIVAVPQTLSLRTAFASRTRTLTLSGKLLFAGLPRPGINVHLAVAARPDLADAQELGIPRTRADGSFALRRVFGRPAAAQHLTVIAYVNFYAGPCSDPPLVPAGCAEQSVAPPPARIAAVTIPKR